MALKPFEFQEHIMIDNFLLKLSELEKKNGIDR